MHSATAVRMASRDPKLNLNDLITLIVDTSLVARI